MTRPVTVLFTLLALSLPGCLSDSVDCPDCSSDDGNTSVQTGSGTTPVGDPCAETQERVPASICFAEYCVGQGTLRVSLGFSVDSGYDLHVLTPGGTEIYFGARTGGGGELDVD
ncbi:MAG: hypothetical protein JW751_13185 [Polyangiaceae bacterium]|nr:hypothetical protein [Polyangiaceae bacterium]